MSGKVHFQTPTCHTSKPIYIYFFNLFIFSFLFSFFKIFFVYFAFLFPFLLFALFSPFSFIFLSFLFSPIFPLFSFYSFISFYAIFLSYFAFLFPPPPFSLFPFLISFLSSLFSFFCILFVCWFFGGVGFFCCCFGWVFCCCCFSWGLGFVFLSPSPSLFFFICLQSRVGVLGPWQPAATRRLPGLLGAPLQRCAFCFRGG